MVPIYLPGRNDRITILGRTGTGKTVGAVWHLSRKNLREETWLGVDYKGDDHLAMLEDAGAPVIDVDDKLPTKPGFYIVRPNADDADAVGRLWRRIHKRRNLGVYVDEGYMVDDDKGYDALLTQGRSLFIPMIILSQRPRWITRFVFSEATFFQVYALNDDDDWRRVAGFLPLPVAWDATRVANQTPSLAGLLNPPLYRSYYYDTNEQQLVKFLPVPPVEESVNVIAQQIRTKRLRMVI